MVITTLSSREFKRDIGRAKRAALAEPVVITGRSKPAHVLLSYEEYQRLSGKRRTLLVQQGLSSVVEPAPDV
ncbi:MAG TPA: type II toxin-antitoxin system Phd/YefM family antitoxin [Rhodanobacter sp.]|nr:type II toxin-antitoxin system Phd/YefM family antitoxin [Rhodanobacter sp.]